MFDTIKSPFNLGLAYKFCICGGNESQIIPRQGREVNSALLLQWLKACRTEKLQFTSMSVKTHIVHVVTTFCCIYTYDPVNNCSVFTWRLTEQNRGLIKSFITCCTTITWSLWWTTETRLLVCNFIPALKESRTVEYNEFIYIIFPPHESEAWYPRVLTPVCLV